MLMMMAYTGCRNNELVNFKVFHQGLDAFTGQRANSAALVLARLHHESTVARCRCRESSDTMRRPRASGKCVPERRMTGCSSATDGATRFRLRTFVSWSASWRSAPRSQVASGRTFSGIAWRQRCWRAVLRSTRFRRFSGHTFITTTMDYYLHPSSRNVKADYHRCAPSFV